MNDFPETSIASWDGCFTDMGRGRYRVVTVKALHVDEWGNNICSIMSCPFRTWNFKAPVFSRELRHGPDWEVIDFTGVK